jgi:hypothetical protein
MAKLIQIEQYQRPQTSEAELLADGWQRCFIADEPRLSDAIETYEEMGMEVALLPVDFDDRECSECMKSDPNRYRLIFSRPRRTQ